MRKILLIDDLRDFQDKRECVIARNSFEALKILSEDNIWDEIWFDHDLGIVNGHEVDDVMKIVDYLCEKAFNDEPANVDIIYVHTSNPVGGNQIMQSLANYGYNCIRVNASKHFIVNEKENNV